jgi:hypothetical protein
MCIAIVITPAVKDGADADFVPGLLTDMKKFS